VKNFAFVHNCSSEPCVTLILIGNSIL